MRRSPLVLNQAVARALTPEAEEAILASVKNGATLRHAAKANGYTDDQVDEWRRIAAGHTMYRVPGRRISPWYAARVREFMCNYDSISATVVTVVTESLTREAVNGNAWAAHQWLRHHPASRNDWKPAENTTQSVVISEVYQKVKQLTTEELLQLVGPADALPSGLGGLTPG